MNKTWVLALVANVMIVGAQEDSSFLQDETLQLKDTTYTHDDFNGLYTYLRAETCDGPTILKCEAGYTDSTPVNEYLVNIDTCLYDNSCLSYHQIL